MNVSVRNVGAARQAGWEACLQNTHAVPERLWVATTDADGTVPVRWLTHQIALADGGADVTCGTVHVPDWSSHPDRVRRRYLTDYRSPGGEPHRHVHGANLGIRGSWLGRLGGFPRLAAHEDQLLVRRARAAGAGVVATTAIPVATSARLQGRCPEGFATTLRALHRVAAGQSVAAALGPDLPAPGA